jgi:outer membrane protein OmpA-like peptidoglycan-associated protein
MKISSGLLAAGLLAACAGPPVEQGDALNEARTLYRQAAADPEVQSRAQMELSSAERALNQAERAWHRGASAQEVEHQAYLAAQRARIALATGQYRAAEARFAVSRGVRSRLALEVREREAAEAKERALATRVNTEQKTAPAPQRVADAAKVQSGLAQLKAHQTERGWIMTLPNEVLFASGSAQLKSGAGKSIEPLATFLRDNPDRDIAIEGFTDSDGTAAANRRLSEARAQAVKNALVSRGVDARRIDAWGYGPSFPVASNETPNGRQLNRRVEIVINPS